MQLRDEELIGAGMLIIATFLYVNVSQLVGTLYAIFSLAYFVTVGDNLKFGIELLRQPYNTVRALGLIAIVIGVWIIISSFAIGIIQPNLQVNILSTEIFRVLALKSGFGVISAEDPLVKFLVWGIFIPVIESMFFLSFVLIFWAKALKVPIAWNPRNKNMWVVALMVGFTAEIFHLTTRMMDSYALVADFVFFFLSALIVFKYRQLFEGIIFHVIINSAIILQVILGLVKK